MSPGTQAEQAFEGRVEYELLQRGWETATGTYDAELGIDTGALWEFIGKTQFGPWRELLELYGGDQDTVMRQFALRVASEIDSRGVLDVLRQGVEDRGVQMDLAYFRPGVALASRALEEYNANVLSVARQFHFSHRDRSQSVGLALFVNGLPVATIELGDDPIAGQDAGYAIAQYRQRDYDDLFLAKRTLVHFAVDPDRAFITTRLKGKYTQFLPFNVGSAGPGKPGGAGNHRGDRDDECLVSYLWRDIWQRDNWLEILQWFMYVDAENTKTGKVNPHSATRVFPRFHQWHAVQRMVAHAREHGAGHNYLIQHSAGSGTFNTVAWLAHRLSALFDDENKPVFDKIIVTSDRVVLDRQLQGAIVQLGHSSGVVTPINEGAAQLVEALEDTTSKIVICTLQMYSFVVDKIAEGSLNGRRYAVIINEADSSQGGAAAAWLTQTLGANAVMDEDEARNRTRVRGSQPNLSYFAFTATPKSRTFELFGTWDPDARIPRSPGERGMYVPFHVYSMQQAIEEGFILDVFANYRTYETNWLSQDAVTGQAELARAESANPEVDERDAEARLVRFAALDPTSLRQRAKVIVEDFRDELAGRLGGRAKAMVVCAGRRHAWEMCQALREWDHTLPDCGFGVLVAFSGSLPDVQEVTESQVNGFPESQLPDRFGYVKADDPAAAERGQDEYRILVVADKYQTGFDQPLLCGMYVDKRLTGVAAVQTLSRLNRVHPLKTQDDVRILDFVNTAEDVPEWLAADSPGETPAEPTWEESLGVAIINGRLRLISIQPNGAVKVLDPSSQYHGLLYVASLEAYTWKSLVEELEELINSADVAEKDLQDFFEQNPQILCGDTYETAEPHIILQRPGAGSLIPDFALKPHNQHALCDLLELKLPSAKLVVGQGNRRRLSSALLEACAQLREYRDYFELEQNRDAVEEAHGLRFFRPNMMVVIGKRSDYLPADLQKAAGDIPSLSIMTYDDLLARARSRIPRKA